ncbi:MAG: hypothetical protein LUE20_02425 [Oscillospiraceae bacterium]|nr:hypothetical protein [Oscillospiraceae bacterium]
MSISKKLEVIYHNGQPDGIRSIRHPRHQSPYNLPRITNAPNPVDNSAMICYNINI